MLKIQVLGNGLIPRGLGLAPRKEPFSADLTLIRTIMSTPGLKVNMIRPEDSRVITLTNQNLMRMWNTYSDAHLKENKPAVPQTAPSVPNPPAPPVHLEEKANQGNPHNITGASVGLGNVTDPTEQKPITQNDVKTAPEKPETPVENKTDAGANKPAEAASDAPAQEKVEDKKPETNNNNQNNNNNKPGYTVKPINSDDRKNGGK